MPKITFIEASGNVIETEAELRQGSPVNPERIDDLNVAVEEVSAFIAQRLRDAA